ncbi:hypothetical protein BpHYR1_006941 [Brachionus plicatilis]|uniref:MULE transposase domain-containing protein n=1 Tax=Brachionus plicatilis TaxID=10195 RepID=A0A3M7SGE0_BRAPC|nr:hypothetical protein BpHYR1_006941 [Brachionus plicatilis]
MNHLDDCKPKIKTKVKQVTASIKDMALKNPDSKPRKIKLECTRDLSEEIVANLPTYNASRQLCNRAKIDIYKDFDIPGDLTFELDDSFKFIIKDDIKDLFLYFDGTWKDGDIQHRMLFFTTAKNLTLLEEYKHWFCDGTFDAVPLIFTQLFSLHILIKGKTLPLVYGLFTIKSEPITISTDFEVGIINALEENFSEAIACGCFFHFKKSIYRQIQSLGLASEYNDIGNKDNLTRQFSKMIACLDFVPLDHVVDTFVQLKSLAPSNLKDLLSYFEEYYIGKRARGRFNTKLGLPRTNNHLEGWHNGIQATIKSHPHLLSLIDCLKLEQSNTENINIRLSTGDSAKRNRYPAFATFSVMVLSTSSYGRKKCSYQTQGEHFFSYSGLFWSLVVVKNADQSDFHIRKQDKILNKCSIKCFKKIISYGKKAFDE